VGAEDQLGLFATAGEDARPTQLGHASVGYKSTPSILTKASGFMSDYDFTLNPYAGCTFGCTYCYAAFFTRDVAKQETWGRWVEVKEDALARLRRMRTPVDGASIYMSSVTDPYQPIERKLGLVRSLLEELVPHQPRLVVQTRSALVTRDIDLFRELDHVRVNMTVTTDLEEIRREFEPWCPTTDRRLRAIAEVSAAGVPTCITMTPLLPVGDPEEFAASLVATGVPRFVVQPFHATRGRFVAGTGREALKLIAKHSWDRDAYERVVAVLTERLPRLDHGQSGFEPA
jgi:DNA repair photolyase